MNASKEHHKKFSPQNCWKRTKMQAKLLGHTERIKAKLESHTTEQHPENLSSKEELMQNFHTAKKNQGSV